MNDNLKFLIYNLTDYKKPSNLEKIKVISQIKYYITFYNNTNKLIKVSNNNNINYNLFKYISNYNNIEDLKKHFKKDFLYFLFQD